jgi:uncharacterized protein DUF4115/PilZ domain-containing protein
MDGRDDTLQELQEPCALPNEAEADVAVTVRKVTGDTLPVGRSIREQRSEPRIEADAPALMIPLANVATRFRGRVLDISRRGVRVRTSEPLKPQPKIGDVYRILSGDDVLLCEVRHCQLLWEGSELGFQIVHRLSSGELNSLVEAYQAGRVGPVSLEIQRTEVASNATKVAQPPSDPVCAVAPKNTERRNPTRVQLLATVGWVMVGGLAVGVLLISSLLIPSISLSSLVAGVRQKAGKARTQEAPQLVLQAGLGSLRAESTAPTVEIPEAVQDSVESARVLPNSKPEDAILDSPNRRVSSMDPAANTTPQKRHATISLTGPSWVSACADGQVLFKKTLASGDSREIEFSKKAIVRVENAGTVDVVLDGKPAGTLGRTGQRRQLELSEQGMRVMPVSDPNDCVK